MPGAIHWAADAGFLPALRNAGAGRAYVRPDRRRVPKPASETSMGKTKPLRVETAEGVTKHQRIAPSVAARGSEGYYAETMGHTLIISMMDAAADRLKAKVAAPKARITKLHSTGNGMRGPITRECAADGIEE